MSRLLNRRRKTSTKIYRKHRLPNTHPFRRSQNYQSLDKTYKKNPHSPRPTILAPLPFLPHTVLSFLQGCLRRGGGGELGLLYDGGLALGHGVHGGDGVSRGVRREQGRHAALGVRLLTRHLVVAAVEVLLLRANRGKSDQRNLGTYANGNDR